MSNDENSRHDHTGHHHHHPEGHGNAFRLAIVLNSIFIVVEFVFGIASNSTALMADAGHNLSDVLGLLLAWGATYIATKPPNKRFTYGLRGSTILAALGNAMLLLVACGGISWEAVQRFHEPPAVAGLTVMVVAGIGIAINGWSALLFMRGSSHDLNIRGAYLHMAADAAVSLGVVAAGAIILFTGWNWVDSAISLLIVATIVYSTWGLLRESIQLAVSAVPASIDASEVEAWLRQLPGVTDVHDLHIWGMSTTEAALTVHLAIPTEYPDDGFLDEAAQMLKSRFKIQHCTLQVEKGSISHHCELAK